MSGLLLGLWACFACTGFYVGKECSADGSVLLGRTVDLGELERLRGKKMSVMDVAALLGKSPAYYSVALNRGRALSVELLAKLAAAFGKTIELRLVRR